jgi:fatty acid desaturase
MPNRRTEGRAFASLVVSVAAAVIVLALGTVGIFFGPLFLPIGVGVIGMVAGPVAYFLGKSALNRIDESKGALAGRSMAVAGWVVAIVAMAFAAIVSLVWIVLVLLGLFGAPPP